MQKETKAIIRLLSATNGSKELTTRMKNIINKSSSLEQFFNEYEKLYTILDNILMKYIDWKEQHPNEKLENENVFTNEYVSFFMDMSSADIVTKLLTFEDSTTYFGDISNNTLYYKIPIVLMFYNLFTPNIQKNIEKINEKTIEADIFEFIKQKKFQKIIKDSARAQNKDKEDEDEKQDITKLNRYIFQKIYPLRRSWVKAWKRW